MRLKVFSQRTGSIPTWFTNSNSLIPKRREFSCQTVNRTGSAHDDRATHRVCVDLMMIGIG
jgi:hypothetical protein